MTPPPSSQKVPQPAYRSTTTPSLLSSPPPTSRTPPVGSRHYDANTVPYNAVEISNADVNELRSMVEHVTKAYREMKAATAGQYLQYNLLAMERSEQMKRMEVELEMKNKEVEVLQSQARRGNSTYTTPVMTDNYLMTISPSDQQHANLRNRCDVLEIQNEELRYRCDDIRAVMLENEAILKEENRRLTERIRENRKHVNMLRGSNGLIETTPYSAFATSNVPPRQRQDDFATPKTRRDDPVSQLLLADRVLSFEANTTPSTPTPGQARRTPTHHRAAHSLSSLPSTPAQARSVPVVACLQDAFHYPRQEHTPKAPQTAPQQTSHRRRLSRDSTISASEGEEEVNPEDVYLSSSSDSVREDIPESQASQEACKMLRKSTSFREGASARSSQRSEAATKSSGLLQTKLYGPIKKPGSGGAMKRKVTDLGSPINAKKSRIGGTHGLGIETWHTSV